MLKDDTGLIEKQVDARIKYPFRVDGIFSDELRKQIPKPDFNYASMPALWSYV